MDSIDIFMYSQKNLWTQKKWRVKKLFMDSQLKKIGTPKIIYGATKNCMDSKRLNGFTLS